MDQRCPFHRWCALAALIAPPLLTVASSRYPNLFVRGGGGANDATKLLPKCKTEGLEKAIQAVLDSSVGIAEALRSTTLGAR